MNEQRRGYTLVELLVVIAIIGVLVALMLPAVQACREAARRMSCGNNLKQIGIGLQNYHDTFLTLPYGARARYVNNVPEENLGQFGPSWYVGLLPFCEQRPLYDRIDKLERSGQTFSSVSTDDRTVGGACGNAKLRWMLCPSSPLPMVETPPGGLPLTVPSYVGISGATNGGQNWGERDFRELRTADGPSSGTFSQGGMLTINRTHSFSSATDGTSHVMVVAEASDFFYDGMRTPHRIDGSASTTLGMDVGGWWFRGCDTAEATFPADLTTAQVFNIRTIGYSNAPANDNNGWQVVGGYRWNRNNNSTVGAFVNLPDSGIGSFGPNNPLVSAHPAGALVAYLDGHVSMLSQNEDFITVKRLATRDDGVAVNPH